MVGWIRLAAELHGTLPHDVPEPVDRSLTEAIHLLYAEFDVHLTQRLAQRVASQVGRLSGRARIEIAGLVNALVLASQLTADARRDSGVETLFADPVRAFREDWLSVLSRLERVDVTKIVTAALVISEALEEYEQVRGQPDLNLPFVFVGGAGDTTHHEDRILLIDESGDDGYTNNAGGPLFPLLPGDALIGPPGVAFGVAWDMGTGNDHYRRGRMAQGYGFAAPGFLLDEGGRDVYEVTWYGQGMSIAGVGVLYDAGRDNDRYLSPSIIDRTLEQSYNSIGTKAASLAGIGLLVDEGGSDVIHQDKVDGLVWGAGGGLGLLANLGPEADGYLSRATTRGVPDPKTFLGPIQVSAEVGGAAILYEEGGDDRYQCIGRVRQGCQAASGSESLALLWDLGGDDKYLMDSSDSIDLVVELLALRLTPIEHPVFPMGQGAGYAVGLPGMVSGLGVLRDDGGDDVYRAQKWAQGYGTFGGVGFLYDTGGGDDRYVTKEPLSGRREDGATWFDGVLGVGIDR